jgi:hypothetical protein
MRKHGASIPVNHRHTLNIFPIENLEEEKAINSLIPIIMGMNNEASGSICNKIFWYIDIKMNDL